MQHLILACAESTISEQTEPSRDQDRTDILRGANFGRAPHLRHLMQD